MKSNTKPPDKRDTIELVEYDPYWPQMATAEIATLYEILPAQHVINIQHVGSTAIPGMLAKPVIDLQVAVDSLSIIKQVAIDTLTAQGYQYWHDKLFFTDYLRKHPQAAADYQQLKIQLMHQYAHDREQYTKAKKHFIDKILKKVRCY